jgi:hypothetical protein
MAVYAYLLLAGTGNTQATQMLSLPKKRKERPSTLRLIGPLSAQRQSKGMGLNFPHFVNNTPGNTNHDKIADALPSVVCDAFRQPQTRKRGQL